MASRNGIFRQPVIVASANADLRSHCIVQIMGQIPHIVTVTDFCDDRIPPFIRQRGILIVDEQQLPAQRHEHLAFVAARGWMKPTIVLCQMGKDHADQQRILYLAVPVESATIMHFIHMAGDAKPSASGLSVA